MAAEYPTAVKTFSNLTNGVDVANDTVWEVAYDEITAIEQALLSTGLAHHLFPDATANNRDLGTASKKWRDLHLANDANVGGDLDVTGTGTIDGNVTLGGTLDVTGAVGLTAGLTVGGVLTINGGVAGTTGLTAKQDTDVTQTEVVNTTSETSVYSYAVPGNTLGSTKKLRLTLLGDYLNNSGGGDTFTVRVKYGATTVATLLTGSLAANAARRPVRVDAEVAAFNSTSAQMSYSVLRVGPAGVTGTGGGAGNIYDNGHNAVAEDSTASKNLVVTVQHTTGAATISFRANTVHVEIVG